MRHMSAMECPHRRHGMPQQVPRNAPTVASSGGAQCRLWLRDLLRGIAGREGLTQARQCDGKTPTWGWRR